MNPGLSEFESYQLDDSAPTYRSLSPPLPHDFWEDAAANLAFDR
jgi:hypothetical protein